MPKDVVNVCDLGYLGVEKDFPEQLSSIPNRKKRNMSHFQNNKRLQQKSYEKENSGRGYHL
jgi:hypothetical protein